jgi:hypothetical protein
MGFREELNILAILIIGARNYPLFPMPNFFLGYQQALRTLSF